MARSTVKTEITGKVWKITAEKGQRLAEDEPIVILESMKMEIPVAAPIACTVAGIVVAEGDASPKATSSPTSKPEDCASVKEYVVGVFRAAAIEIGECHDRKSDHQTDHRAHARRREVIVGDIGKCRGRHRSGNAENPKHAPPSLAHLSHSPLRKFRKDEY